MSKISDSFQTQCAQNKTSDYAVIVTLARESDGLQSGSVDPKKLQPIAGISGVYKAVLTGNEVLELSQNTEVEAVDPDEQFGILN